MQATKLDLRQLPVLARQQIDRAELPQKYLAARRALQECARIDELKDIKDKHEAIAHYAKQAKDKTLQHFAERIKLRAFERIGELLAEIPEYKNRRKAAEDSGIALATANRAYEAAQTPKRVRDKLIEATPPPTITQLAQYGLRYMPKSFGAAGSGFHDHARREEDIKATPLSSARLLTEYLGGVCVALDAALSDGCGGRFKMAQLGRALDGEDAARARQIATQILERLDEFERYLPK